MRSSTRATSEGSDHARYELGRSFSFSLRNVPAATSSRAQAVVLGVGAVAPVDAVGLGEGRDFFDPLLQLGVANGSATVNWSDLRVHRTFLLRTGCRRGTPA